MNKNLWLLYLTIGAELFRVHLLVNYQQTSSAFAVLINFATAKNDDDDDGLIPAIRKKVKCFAETNCTACSQMHDCVWCSNGRTNTACSLDSIPALNILLLFRTCCYDWEQQNGTARRRNVLDWRVYACRRFGYSH